VFEHFDDIGRTVGRQVEQHALLAEALANVGDQAGQVEVVGIDLVDDDHPAQLALGGMAHHALGHQFDAGLGVDDDQRRIDPGQRGDGLAGKIGIARGVDQMNMGVLVAEIHHGGSQGVAGFLFLGIGIAHGIAFFNAALGGDGAGREQQRLGQAGLAGGTMADQGNGTKGLGCVFRHLVLPEQMKISDQSAVFAASTASATSFSAKWGPSPRIRPPAMTTSSKPTINWMAARRNAGPRFSANHTGPITGRSNTGKPVFKPSLNAAGTVPR
jgi:hypothetical protein